MFLKLMQVAAAHPVAYDSDEELDSFDEVINVACYSVLQSMHVIVNGSTPCKLLMYNVRQTVCLGASIYSCISSVLLHTLKYIKSQYFVYLIM